MKRQRVILLATVFVLITISLVIFLLVRYRDNFGGKALIAEVSDTYTAVGGRYPLAKITHYEGYLLRCVTSRQHFHYGEVELHEYYLLKAWADCFYLDKQGAVKSVAIPLHLENILTDQRFVTVTQEPRDNLGSAFAVGAIKVRFGQNDIFGGINLDQPTIVSVMFGPPAPSQPGYYDFFTAYLQSQDLTQLEQFAQAGDPSFLANYGSAKAYLPAYKVNLDIAQ